MDATRRKTASVIVSLLASFWLAGCSRQPVEAKVTHPNDPSDRWLRSTYEVTKRETKDFDDYSGKYVVLTLKHGNQLITAECGMTFRSTTGEYFPSTPAAFNDCGDLPMGAVQLDRFDWSALYFFTPEGNNTEAIILDVKKIEQR